MKFIDLETILDTSYPETGKKIPRFVIRLLKNIIRQDLMNEILTKYENVEGLDFLHKIIEEFELNLKISGLENLPETSRCIFVANHPFGIIDGLVIATKVLEKYGSLNAIGNNAFLLIPQLRALIADVNVFGKSSRESCMKLDELFHSQKAINTFPSGEVSRFYKFKVQDCDWKKSFVKKAEESDRLIVPVTFYGRNSILFYAIFIIRRLLFIQTNIELILLPREMFGKRKKTIRVHFGRPINTKNEFPGLTADQKTKKIKEIVYQTKKLIKK
jgi:putative hemolysin